MGSFVFEELKCNYCLIYLESGLEMQKHLPKCKRRHKGKKNLLMCTVNSLHHIPKHAFQEHVKQCTEAHGSNSEEPLELQITEEAPGSYEIDRSAKVDALNIVDENEINLFRKPFHRIYQCIWGLDETQRKEWRRAEYQRIQNLLDNLPIDHIKYPRANGSYVNIGEMIEKIRNKSKGTSRSKVSNFTRILDDEHCHYLPSGTINSPNKHFSVRKKTSKKGRKTKSSSKNFLLEITSIFEDFTKNEHKSRNSESDNVMQTNRPTREEAAANEFSRALNIPDKSNEINAPNFSAPNNGTYDPSGARKRTNRKNKSSTGKLSNNSIKEASKENENRHFISSNPIHQTSRLSEGASDDTSNMKVSKENEVCESSESNKSVKQKKRNRRKVRKQSETELPVEASNITEISNTRSVDLNLTDLYNTNKDSKDCTNKKSSARRIKQKSSTNRPDLQQN